MLKNIFYTALYVSDQDRALDFYTNTLGLEKQVDNPTPDGPRFLTVGVDEPYAPADLVYNTVSRHARPHGLLAAMIEIRNDEIADEAGQRAWADRLADILLAATPALLGANAEHAVV